jgi:hypothetical protein
MHVERVEAAFERERLVEAAFTLIEDRFSSGRGNASECEHHKNE